MQAERPAGRAVAVTGLGVFGAIAPDVPTFLARLEAGRPLIRIADGPAGLGPIAGLRLDPAARPLPELDPRLDPVERSRAQEALRGADLPVLAAAQAAIEAAHGTLPLAVRHPPGRIAVVLGGSNLAHPQLLEAAGRFARNPAFLTPRLALTSLDSHAAAVVAAILGAEGPVMSIGTAAASGAACLVAALDLIRAGRADACLVIGAMQGLSAIDYQALRGMRALAGDPLDDASRPFDAASTGVAPVEAAACILLERSAEHPLAWLSGGAIIGGGSPLPSPSVEQEARTMQAALADAGLAPDRLDAVIAHATGTAKGDAAEAEAIHAVLAEHTERVWTAAPKAVTGHALTAAGTLGAIQAVLMLQAQRVFPQPPRRQPIAPHLRMAEAGSVDAPLAHILVNAFGFASLGAAIVLSRAEAGA
jgi:malonyl-ACP decarboxylase